MGAAEDAYAAAVAEIAWVKEAGGTELDLNPSEFSALEKLPPEIAGLTELQSLRLDGTQVTDIAPLADLIALQTLWLTGTQVADITPLAGLTALQTLGLDDTRVVDVSSLAGLTALQALSLGGKQTGDISTLAGLITLQTLWLSNTLVVDISPLAGLKALQTLFLSNTQVADISPLAGLNVLQKLRLDDTRVADITPVAGLTALQEFWLYGTQVTDISPLMGLTLLQTLGLNSTQVTDLRPLRDLTELGSRKLTGLSFRDTPALRDPELAQLSEIDDSQTRTKETLAYLRTLPPWPEPLPWLVKPRDPTASPPPAPEPEPGLPMTVRDGLLDLVRSPHGADDDPLRTRSFARLHQAVTALVRHGNRYPELVPVIDRLLAETSGSLEEASLYDIHLDIAVLTDRVIGNDARPTAERIDPDCLAAMREVMRLGPPLTIDDPLVIRYEKAHADMQARTRDATMRAGERATVEAIARGGDGIGDGARDLGRMLVAQPDGGGRVETTQALLTKNSVIRAGLYLAGAAGVSLVGLITVESAKAAWAAAPGLWSFLVNNKDAIMAAAWGWGDQAQVWTADLMSRAVEIARLAQKDDRKKD